MKMCLALLCCLSISSMLFSQERTKELYKQSISLLSKEYKWDTLILMSDDQLPINNIKLQKGYLKIADSAFFSGIANLDTSFKIFKAVPIALVDENIDIVLNDYTFVQKNGNASLLFIKSIHFIYAFDCKSKKYLFVRKKVVSM